MTGSTPRRFTVTYPGTYHFSSGMPAPARCPRSDTPGAPCAECDRWAGDRVGAVPIAFDEEDVVVTQPPGR